MSDRDSNGNIPESTGAEDFEDSGASPARGGQDIGKLATAVDKAISAALEGLGSQSEKGGAVKTSVTDLVRLLQLRKELESERPRKIIIRWIDSLAKSMLSTPSPTASYG